MRNSQPDKLLKEKNLLDIYQSSRGRLSINRFNIILTWFVFSLLVVYVSTTPENPTLLAEKVRKLVELGFSFSSGILGFLIAGFTIFATVSDKELFVKMAQMVHRPSGLSYLKFNFFTLMYVFILYVGFSVFCLVVILFGSTSGLFSIMLKGLTGEFYEMSKKISVSIGLVAVGTYLFYILMLLQSFIFNIYHIVMTGIEWEIHKDENPD
jgi:hypothetical protein